jgi:DNA-binding NtrC family response regulator
MKTIMIVDDETSILEEVKKSLEQDDFKVITAENNRKALELIEEDKENRYGLILINTSMPDTKIPAFFSMKPESKKNIDTSKKEDFLQKPFTKEQLLEFVKSKIEQ